MWESHTWESMLGFWRVLWCTGEAFVSGAASDAKLWLSIGKDAQRQLYVLKRFVLVKPDPPTHNRSEIEATSYRRHAVMSPCGLQARERRTATHANATPYNLLPNSDGAFWVCYRGLLAVI